MWNRRTFPVITIGLLVVAIVAHSLALGAIWAVLFAGYLISVVIHSRIRCLHCGGTGELKGRFFFWTFRRCPRCVSGRTIRRGATVIGFPHVKAQAQAQRTARENTSTRQRW